MPNTFNQGPLTETVYYILLALNKPIHGYGIMQKVFKLSNSRVEMGAGTLYGAINTLLLKQWIEPVKNDEQSRKKVYCITEKGILILRGEVKRLKELVDIGNLTLGKE